MPEYGPFKFLKKDLEELDRRIYKLQEELRMTGKQIGESCRQSAETCHDNFPWEEARRQHQLLERQLKSLRGVRNVANLVQPDPDMNKVGMGRRVTVEETSGQTRTLFIGSYMMLGENLENVISYRCPVGEILMGAKVGDIREGTILGVKKQFKILGIA